MLRASGLADERTGLSDGPPVDHVQALRLFGERDLDPAAVAVPIARMTPCPTGTGPLALPAPAEVEAQLAAMAAIAALKAEGNACASPARPPKFAHVMSIACCCCVPLPR